ncbi:MAG: class I SAM-dependent methyltransferase [Candidatus Bathyarchaeia archaeon]
MVWLVFAMLGVLCAIVSFIWVYILLFSVGFLFLAFDGYLASKVGKPLLQKDISKLACLDGFEQVLDVGTGQGLLAIGLAKHLSSGCAYGVDIWSRVKTSGYSLFKAIQNAQIEGVVSRVSLLYSDARRLAFRAESFDLVVSNFLLSVLSKEERRKALTEMCRVLRGGGKLIISDVGHANT